ncbi:uncharacterized protein LOC119689640 [Teleopsis dalmanni]|uniref:uncharacterized protein LOC119689640 n=1 Tax=Teleopsis dalmanni TaxID=139649 RepID=UPI0018CE13A1|nr:uncharacterized protein LOC119689640 [Teleopsis dalmanni]
MPGVVFLIVVPTANFERELIFGTNSETPPPVYTQHVPVVGTNVDNSTTNLNISVPEHGKSSGNGNNTNAILRLEVELRDKNAPKYRRGVAGRGGMGIAATRGGVKRPAATTTQADNPGILVPLEKVLEELLVKLEIEHVTWTTGKRGYFHHVIFPLQAGEPCETTLHCLTELGIGTKLNSSVSVLPCSVSYDALSEAANRLEYSADTNEAEELSKWNNFVESIKSKLTVKQVVDGVRAGGALSFDYLLLIVTADSLAALGLVENNAPNIVAAMLVSPLMGPVMSITFAAIISDRELMRVGFISLSLGMFISCLFGFIFGLILGTTEMPWGSGDWPTEEMRGRGNIRALWMGVLWALTSGTGVAVALLQGYAGPLIGVAISASLLPPVVNCGLFWALACIWLIYPDKRIPHLKGEPLNGNTSYPFLYTDYLPTEFLINGIVSSLLTVVNVICIFITAIIVLKIKEVSAPYTASPDLKRFWETDLRTVRKTNRSTLRGSRDTHRQKLSTAYKGLEEPRNNELNTVLEQALKEAEDDVTFKKVKRMSYSSNAAGELTQRLAKIAGLSKRDAPDTATTAFGSYPGSRINSIRNSRMNVDLKALDKLISNLLEKHTATSSAGANRKSSMKLNRWHPTSRSAHTFNITEGNASTYTLMPEKVNSGNVGGGAGSSATGSSGTTPVTQHASVMPTIMESNTSANVNTDAAETPQRQQTPVVRNVLQSVANVPQRFSQSLGITTPGVEDEENLNLIQNYIA